MTKSLTIRISKNACFHEHEVYCKLTATTQNNLLNMKSTYSIKVSYFGNTMQLGIVV